MIVQANNNEDRPHRVLIVDDDRDFTESLREILEPEGYTIVTVDSVRAAREAVGQFDAQVALLDIRLGRDDGVDLIAQLRQLRSGILCVMMTAYRSVESAVAALQQGAYSYLTKPLHPEELLVTLERCFDKLRLEGERIASELALKAQIRRNELILSTTHDGFWVFGLDGGLREVNDACCRMLGYSREELLAMNVVDIEVQENPEEIQAQIERVLVKGYHRFETRHRRKDGSIADMEACVSSMDLNGDRFFFTFLREITARKQAEARMHKLSSALEQTADSVVITDRDGIIEYVNPSFEATTGYSKKDALGKTPRILKSDKQSTAFYQNLWRIILDGEVFREVFINRKKDGTLFYEQQTITPLKDVNGKVTHFVATGKDITKRMETQEQLQFLAHHDALTELPNRLLFMDRLRQSLAHARRWHKRRVAVLFLDLDRFKNINDTLGHDIGDRLLQKLGGRLIGALREGDTVARLGGDEFGVILDDLTSANDIASIAKKILDTLEAQLEIEGHDLCITASIGISMYPNDGENSNTLLKNADVAMYKAKDLGRNNFQFYSSDMSVRAFERLTLENSLRHALERRELRLYYQPQVDIQNGKVIGVEALLRWQHPNLGLVAPMDFVPLLEETGLIVPVGEWVIQTACAQAQAWNNNLLKPLRITVNLSGRQTNELNFAATVERFLCASGLDPTLLELEITETILMRNVRTTVEVLNALHEVGVRFAVDDFGTGYSSLSYLKRFPIDTLKVDRSFVRDITNDADDAALVEAIIAMGRALRLEVIAEGVETKEQLEFLRAHNCSAIQGYLFSNPLPPEEIEPLLRNGWCDEEIFRTDKT